MTSATAEKWYLELKLAVGSAGQTQSIAQIMRNFKVPEKFARYHVEKFFDATFHAGTWGGARNVVFNDEEQLTVEVNWRYLTSSFVCPPLGLFSLYMLF